MTDRLKAALIVFEKARSENNASIARVNAGGPRSFAELMNDPEETSGRRAAYAKKALEAQIELEAAAAEAGVRLTEM